MVSTEVKRTLVKSLPELWAELGNLAGLERHLAEFGEIRITRSEPEKLIEWEAERASGTVKMKPSGWGTQVLLSVTRELELADEPPAGEDLPPAEDLPLADAQPAEDLPPADDPPLTDAQPAETAAEADAARAAVDAGAEQPDLEPPLDEQASPHAETELEPPGGDSAAQAPCEQTAPPGGQMAPAGEPPQRTPDDSTRGESFFSRLLHWRRRRKLRGTEMHAPEPATAQRAPAERQHVEQAPTAQAAEQPSQPPTTAEPAETEQGDPPAQQTQADQTPSPPPSQEQAQAQTAADEHPGAAAEQPAPAGDSPPDHAAELAAAEQLAAEQTTAVLVAVLDHLGAAHHRPFSRG